MPNLEGLIALAGQDGVDIRPTLLRVLTDLYVQKPMHTLAEEHRYTELALSLLAGVDSDTRAAVAKKLAGYPQAPHAVIRHLARDVIDVAEPVLRYASCLSNDELLGIKDLGPLHAAAIEARHAGNVPLPSTHAASPLYVERADLGDSVAQSGAGERISSAYLPSDAAGTPRSPFPRRDRSPARVGDAFLNAGTAERCALLTQIETESLVLTPAVLSISPGVVGELEAAALQRRPDAFARTLERVLRISSDMARRIVDDSSGEPVVVATKAIAMPADVVVRVLLFLNPRVGHSVQRVFALVDLHERLSAQAARRLVASWQSCRSYETPADYRPLNWDDERVRARHDFAAHARRRVAGEERVANSDER